MQPPPGYSVPDGHVCRLRRTLYGLKQAPRAWFTRFTSMITAVGFTVSSHDPALFVHVSHYYSKCHHRRFGTVITDDF